MSIRINNKIISGTYTAQSYRYVGEIFQSALPIEDSRVALLDGHKIYESEGYGSFIRYITSLTLLYPQLSCTEDEWQLSDITYGECGKFVISEDCVRLPKIVNFVQGLSSLQDLATLVEAGLPNIAGSVTTYNSASISITKSGAFTSTSVNKSGISTTAGTGSEQTINIDASRSNPIYGNSDTVQPQSIRYPYYIVLATGVTQEVKVKEELTTNIPFTLFESKYSEVELNNTSWLLSNGQWNSKELYPSAYNELVKEYNVGSNKYSIKLYTDEYGDYDFVLNLDDETFRLPLKTKFSPVRENSSVIGNGMTVGFTTGSQSVGLIAEGSGVGVYSRANVFGLAQGTSGDTTAPNPANCSLGLTTDPTKSGIELYNDISDLYLYFYVGDTNINVNLVDTGKLTQEVANLIPNNSALIANFGLPSEEYIDITIGATKATYTMPADGYLAFYGNAPNTSEGGHAGMKNLTLGNFAVDSLNIWGRRTACIMPVRKNDQVEINFSNAISIRLYLLEGNKGE